MMSQTNNGISAETSPGSQKRQRAKQACEPCRLRKRRCDGELPCDMCVKFEYTCYFEKHSRKRSKIVEKDAQDNGIISPPLSTAQVHRISSMEASESPVDILPKTERAAPDELLKLRFMEANSGIAFTRFLGMRLDATAGPKLFTFGWNLGSTIRPQPITRLITDFLSRDQMEAMAKLYFENVHPLYGFLNRAWITAQIGFRYAQMQPLPQCPDHVFQCLAVLGALFAPGAIDNVMPGLVEAAKLSLESINTAQPTLIDVQAWLLRTCYLRFSGLPHTCYMASCTTMHLIECIGLHQESTSKYMHTASADDKQDPEEHRRTFWAARLFNSWISFEYGRSRVALRGITCQLPAAREGDFTREYVQLYTFSCCLDPDLLDRPGQWDDFLQQLEAFEAHHECIVLSKANLGLAAYRRLRLTSPNLQCEQVNRIISLALDGLQAARTMAERHKPWWHVANVPFQTICVFLAIDTKETLSHLANAMRVLEYVAEAFPSPSIKEALKTSRFLVRLSKRKKDQDSEVLAQILLKDAGCDPRPENLEPAVNDASDPPVVSPAKPHGPPKTTSSGEDWNLDYLNNPDFDWNRFLAQDMPAFQNIAPDGMI